MTTELTLKDAAQAVGKDPSTLTRAVNSGKLSCRKDVNGNRVFDPAELVRVYGALRAPDAEDDQGTDAHEGDSAEVRALEVENARLSERVREMEGRIVELKEERERWQKESDDWKEQAQVQTRLLTHATKEEAPPPPPPAPAPGFWGKLFGT